MTEITTATCEYDYQTINQIKKENPNIKIIVGGTHATILPEQVLKECEGIDYVVRQEYDYTVPEIIQTGDISKVLGVSYRENGEIKHTPDRPQLEDLDELPYVSKVYQQFLDVNDYAYAFAQKPMIQIVSSRGCPNHCNFCS
jgi:radical SAM superfamily enzyme YgiQ (UPF0313 family)